MTTEHPHDDERDTAPADDSITEPAAAELAPLSADEAEAAGQDDALAEEAMPAEPRRTSRDVLYESIGIQLVNAGVLTPAAEFVSEVRETAGYRVAPREVAAIVERLNAGNADITAGEVARIAAASRGGRSQRQQRHADEWREFGAALAIRGMDASPEAQRAFIGRARHHAGNQATDQFVLQVALALAEARRKLEPDTVGKVARRLARSAADLTPDQISELALRELRAVDRQERAGQASRPKTRSSSGERRRQSSGWGGNPGARKLRPGRRNVRAVPEKQGDDER